MEAFVATEDMYTGQFVYCHKKDKNFTDTYPALPNSYCFGIN